MISFDKKFIFFHQGKCGGSSIKRELKVLSRKYKFDVNHSEGHEKLEFFFNLIVGQNLNPDDFFKFTIVRNPWDRAVSWYYHWHMIHQLKEKEPFNPWLKSKGKNLSFIPSDQTDYTIKLEEIDIGMSYVLDKLGIPPKTIHSHINYDTGRPQKDYREYYDSETKEIVYIRNRDMIEKFNYIF